MALKIPTVEVFSKTQTIIQDKKDDLKDPSRHRKDNDNIYELIISLYDCNITNIRRSFFRALDRWVGTGDWSLAGSITVRLC